MSSTNQPSVARASLINGIIRSRGPDPPNFGLTARVGTDLSELSAIKQDLPRSGSCAISASPLNSQVVVDNSLNEQLNEEQLLDLGLEQLRRLLPSHWTVQASSQPSNSGRGPASHLVQVTSRGMGATAALVEVRRSFSPQDARRLLGSPIGHRLRAMAGNTPIVVVAPYLSPRTRELLATEDVSYIDLAGNVRLDLQNLFVDIEKATRNPNGNPTPAPGLRGAMGGRVVRVLVEAWPPYALTDIAGKAGVDRGYASRILDALSDQALIEREPRGKVTDADWPALLRARAQHLDLLGPAAKGFVAPQGVRQALAEFVERPPEGLWAVTGSFAAVRFAPVAAPALLVVYTMNPGPLAAEHHLLEAHEGADVTLVRPSNYGPFDRTHTADRIVWAGLSQVVLDCLSGNGRMPAEGEALLGWMADHESEWRTPIDKMAPPAGKP